MTYQDVEVTGVPKHAWLLWLVLGVLSAIVGIWLILSPKAAIGTLALLLAIALFMNGIAELVTAGDRFKPWFGYLLAAIFLIAGFVVLLRPGKSLWFLAIVVGISIIVTGLGQVMLAFMDREAIRHWIWLALLGAVGIVVGVLAIVWPDITIWALALLIGIRLVIFGIVQIAIAFQVRSLTA
ncbi:MAG: HdeD family acid-resistance protein [Microthrixaceae bacterium]